jgi:hypothetical protein
MDNNAADIHEDSGRYLQEYVQSKLLYSILRLPCLYDVFI